MPFTVITLKNAPPSLRGDLTKWMQEIATGVYVGNFNTKVREELWERVKESVKSGEATMSYTYRNEIGYYFETWNTKRTVVDYEGIPLVLLEELKKENVPQKITHQSRVRQMHIANQMHSTSPVPKSIVFLDIETDGLKPQSHQIIEIGAIKVEGQLRKEFHALIQYDGDLPKEIESLTGINAKMLQDKGRALDVVLQELIVFIESSIITGYGIAFDLQFINEALRKNQKKYLTNKTIDLMKDVKKEKIFLKNYKLETVLKEYGINEKVPHRALEDAKLIAQLATKVNAFSKYLK